MPVDSALLQQLRQIVIHQKNAPVLEDPGEDSSLHEAYQRLAAYDAVLTQRVIQALGGRPPEITSLQGDPALDAMIERLSTAAADNDRPALEQYRRRKSRLDETLVLLIRIATQSGSAR